MEDFPSKTDRLFKPDTTTSKGAWMNNPAGGWFLYIEGYRNAAEILFSKIEENNSYKNTLVYPFVFNSRQTIELMLKELLTKGYKILGEQKEFKTNHFLKQQWDHYKNEIIPRTTKTTPHIYEGVDSIINEFDKIDAGSMNFRYPFSKDPGKPPSLNIRTLDLDNFKTIMDKLIVFLDGQWHILDQIENPEQA